MRWPRARSTAGTAARKRYTPLGGIVTHTDRAWGATLVLPLVHELDLETLITRTLAVTGRLSRTRTIRSVDYRARVHPVPTPIPYEVPDRPDYNALQHN